MQKQTESSLKTFTPVLMGMVFAILQAFTVYYTKNVETSISKLDTKLDQTWEMTLVTKTELASLKTLVEAKGNDIIQVEQQLRDNRELLLGHLAEASH